MIVNIALYSTFAVSSILTPNLTTNVKSSVQEVSAIDRLKMGNQRFVDDKSEHSGQDSTRRMEVAKGQKPFAIVLTCADSRLSPEIIFDQGLGDLFVLRVAGNIAEPGALASIEYAVAVLGASQLVVLGHSKCGAVKAAVDTYNAKPVSHKGHSHAEPSFLPGLISQITPSVKETSKWKGSGLDNSISQNVINTAKKVASLNPLKKMVNSGKLAVMGSVYDLDSGVVKNIYIHKPASK